MISIKDLEKINRNLEDIKQARELDIKAKGTLILEDGTSALIYHMGKGNKTLRIDLKEK